MARFKELVENGGVTVPDLFMAVGLHGFNLIALEDAQGFNLMVGDAHNRIELSRVTRENVAHVSMLLTHQFKLLLMSDDDAKAYLAAMFNVLNAGPGSQLWLVKGKATGRTGITASRGRHTLLFGVWVLPPKRFTIGFRFVRMYDEHNHQSLTKFTPADAPGWVDELNAVYGMQANISFTLADTAVLSLTVNSEDIYHDEFANNKRVVAIDYLGREKPKKDGSALKYFEPERSKTADVTIFVVFKYLDPVLQGLSQTFPEKQICIIEDTPGQDCPFMKGEDPFLVNFAHEVAHFLSYRLMGKRVEIHHDRQGILMSSKLQSIRLDSGVVGSVNLVR